MLGNSAWSNMKIELRLGVSLWSSPCGKRKRKPLRSRGQKLRTFIVRKPSTFRIGMFCDLIFCLFCPLPTRKGYTAYTGYTGQKVTPTSPHTRVTQVTPPLQHPRNQSPAQPQHCHDDYHRQHSSASSHVGLAGLRRRGSVAAGMKLRNLNFSA